MEQNINLVWKERNHGNRKQGSFHSCSLRNFVCHQSNQTAWMNLLSICNNNRNSYGTNESFEKNRLKQIETKWATVKVQFDQILMVCSHACHMAKQKERNQISFSIISRWVSIVYSWRNELMISVLVILRRLRILNGQSTWIDWPHVLFESRRQIQHQWQGFPPVLVDGRKLLLLSVAQSI